MASPNHSSTKGDSGKRHTGDLRVFGLTCIDWYLRLRWIVSICESEEQITFSNIVASVCIISIIRLIVLSRLEEFDVTCKPLFLRTSPVQLIRRHVRELRGCRDLVSRRTRDGVRRATEKQTVPAC